MAGRDVRHVSEIGRLDAGGEIEIASRVHHPPRHRPVLRAAEEIDPIPLEAGKRVDHLLRRELLRFFQQSEFVWFAEERLHALIERSHDVASGAEVGPTGDHSCSGDAARKRHLGLHRHVGSAREPRNRCCSCVERQPGRLWALAAATIERLTVMPRTALRAPPESFIVGTP
jgi:hypothetical protein